MSLSNYILSENFSRIANALKGNIPHINRLGIMTPVNPLGVELNAQENNARLKAFTTILRRYNFKGYPINPQWLLGKFGGNIEKSYFIPHVDRETLIELAAKFSQKSVIWGQKLGDKINFEYIETPESQEPISISSYKTIQERDVVLTGAEAQDRDDFFSATPYPKSGVNKKTSKKVEPRKFVIPFFDDRYEKSEKMESVEIVPQLSFNLENLPKTPEIQNLVEEIQKKESDLYSQGKTAKFYWETRGSLEISLNNLRNIMAKQQ
jgi:hypothetical protein